MKVLVVHSKYGTPGGEDAVVETESSLLRRAGVVVERATWDNREIQVGTTLERVSAGVATVWNQRAADRFEKILHAFHPDIVHVHNTFPSASPSIYRVARAARVPVVQSLHNYRLQCLNAMHLRGGRVCDDCVGRLPWRGVLNACYRDSRLASLAVFAMVATHRLLRSWDACVDLFLVPTNFARDLLGRGGLPVGRIAIKRQVLERDLGVGAHKGAFGLYVGRLSQEKGVSVAIEGWRRAETGLPLVVVGDGPEMDALRALSADDSEVKFLGQRPQAEVWELMQQATALLVPSLVYEVAPMVVIEAFCTGLPFIGSDLGSVAELAIESGAGWLACPNDPSSWQSVIEHAIGDPAVLAEKGRSARRTYESHHTAEYGTKQLLEHYRKVCSTQRAGALGVN